MNNQPDVKVGKGAAAASLGTAISRATGLLRLSAMTYAIGVVENKLADTYNLANTTPNIIYELAIGGILSSVFIRLYIEVRDREGQQEAWDFIARVTTIVTMGLGLLTVLGVFIAPLIFRAYTIGGPAVAVQQRSVGTLLLRLFVPQIVFYGFGTISTAVLNAHRRFGVPMFAPVLNNLTTIATFIGFSILIPKSVRSLSAVPSRGVLLLGIGTTAGVIFQGMIPWLYMRKLGYRRRSGLGFADPRLRRLANLSLYMFGYVATNQLGLWVALFLANRVQGGVAGYQSAFQFFQLPHGLLAVSIAVVIYTGLTERAVADDMEGFARQLGQGLRAIAFVVLPAIAGYIALAPSVVHLLLQHGLTGSASTALISTVLRSWAIGIFFFSTFYMILRAYYALGDTRTPMLINIAALGVNVVVDVVLFTMLDGKAMKVAGLAIGHSLSYLVAAVLAGVMIKKRVGARVFQGYARTVGATILASVLTGTAAWLAARALSALFHVSETSSTVPTAGVVAGATLAGLLIYAGTTWLLRIEEFKWVASIMWRRHN
ncbi:MAG: murein biosynthesis integral membrane protein MurJ [Actinomycetota bacterium]